MKRRTGQLTDEEREELRSTPIIIGGGPNGGGLLVPPQGLTPEEWRERHGGVRQPATPEESAESGRDVGDDVPKRPRRGRPRGNPLTRG